MQQILQSLVIKRGNARRLPVLHRAWSQPEIEPQLSEICPNKKCQVRYYVCIMYVCIHAICLYICKHHCKMVSHTSFALIWISRYFPAAAAVKVHPSLSGHWATTRTRCWELCCSPHWMTQMPSCHWVDDFAIHKGYIAGWWWLEHLVWGNDG